MGSFDKDEARRIVMEGTDAEKTALIDELERQLRERKFGLVWEHGGDGTTSAFPAEEIVARYARHIPIPQYQEELSLSPQSGSLSASVSNGERERKRESSSELNETNIAPVDGRDGNLLLEGDNYVWLKVLEQSHKGKIDVIYIDAPYNTGHRDFSYNDAFIDATDSFSHSKYLDFMFQRLRIAHQILSSDGAFFLSCDDHEQAYMQVLCNEIFGRENFIGQIVWRKQGGGKQDSKYLANICEYVLCYRKSTLLDHFAGTTEIDESIFNKIDEHGRIYRLMSLDFGSLSYSKKLDYPIELPNGEYCYPGGDYEAYLKRQSGDHAEKDWRWRVSQTEYIKRKQAGIIEFTCHKGRWKVQERLYPNYNKEKVFSNLYDKTTNRTGNNDLKNIFGTRIFTYPKPVAFIKFILQLYPKSNPTILDFFAGSGTTAQAVAELNAEDGGNRRWILVTNNEGETEDDPSTGIMRSVTKPRIDTVLTGIRPDGTKYSDGTGDGYSFFTYDIDSVPRSESSNRNRRMLTVPQYLDGFIRIRWGVARSDIRSSGTCFPVDYESKTTHVVALLTDGSGKVELDDIRSEAQALVNEKDRQRVIVAPAAAVLVARPIWDTIVGDADIELLSYDDLFDNDFLS